MAQRTALLPSRRRMAGSSLMLFSFKCKDDFLLEFSVTHFQLTLDGGVTGSEDSKTQMKGNVHGNDGEFYWGFLLIPYRAPMYLKSDQWQPPGFIRSGENHDRNWVWPSRPPVHCPLSSG